MKTFYTTVFCLMAMLFISSCSDKYTEELTMNVPVYMDYAALRSSVHSGAARDLVHPGKIYFKDNYLLIVEYREGIHIVDVSNPSAPQNKRFVEVPGCIDIAVKNNFLYADSYVDLVIIDLSDPANPKETGRLKDVFPYMTPMPENTKFPCAQIDTKKGIVAGWEVKREEHELERRYYPSYPTYDSNYVSADKAGLSNGGSASGSSSFGKSGSMARFGLYDRYLYVTDNYILYLFDALNAAAPVKAGMQNLQGNIETMFIYDKHLFFGTTTGMLVYSLKIPSTPEYLGSFWHTTSCDPVVIQDGYAYITLRGGTSCNASQINRLDVVQLSDDYKHFQLVNSYNMTGPYGLGIDGNTLFICDGEAGLKVYDVTDKYTIDSHLIASFPSIQTYDVIPADGYLFMVGDDGFFLYDYSDIKNIRQIGHIPVVKKFMPD